MFKPKSDAIQIKQDNFKIPCRNGVEFHEDGIVRFEIPRNAGFVDLANTYLECEVDLTNANNTADQNDAQPMLQLDRMAGCQNLINQLTIRSEGRVLEELRGYNVYANVHYNATLTDGAMNRRSRLEGCSPSYLPVDNPFYSTNKIIQSENAPVNATTGLNTKADCYKPLRRKVCLPLLGGLFTNPRSHPAMVMPLEVEIILEKALRVLRCNNRGDGITSIQCDDIPQNNAGGPGFPARRRVVVNHAGAFGGLGGATAPSVVPANGVEPVAGEENISPINLCPYRVGQQVRLTGVNIENAGDITVGITSVHLISETSATPASRGKIMLTFDADVIGGGVADASNVVLHQLDNNGNLLAGAGSVGYKVFNPRLVVAKVVPPPAVVQQISTAIAKGQYNQDIVSYTNIDNAIPASQSVSTNILSVDLSRVKSILSVPTSQANTENLGCSNYLQGQWLHSTEYEYQIDNKLQPDRRVPMTREFYPTITPVQSASILKKYRLGNHAGALHRYEVEKALRSANIQVKNLNFITNNPSNYLAPGGNNDSQQPPAGFNAQAFEPASWLVGRSLGAGVGTSQNLVAKSCLLYLNYNPASNMVKLLRNFLVHIRTISVSMNGVSVYY